MKLDFSFFIIAATAKSMNGYWLDTITTFNINARYDSYKQSFYRKCTNEFTADWIEKINEIRQWIKARL